MSQSDTPANKWHYQREKQKRVAANRDARLHGPVETPTPEELSREDSNDG